MSVLSSSHEVISQLFLAENKEYSAATGGQTAVDFAKSQSMRNKGSIASSKNLDEDSHMTGDDIGVALIKPEVPDMWSWNYIGLYSQYASVGLLYGMSGTLLPFCVYTFDGATNVCANAQNIVFFAWNFKIFFAILTDSFRPFGMRRKPWMIAGWGMVLVLLLILAIFADKMDASTWLATLLVTQCFLMLSDVPADGYSVELGQLETEEQRGQILATGQRVRFSFCIVAGVIQTFLLNGPSTNDSDCAINLENCWSWGLTINQYYGLMFVLVAILTIPIFWLKELDAQHIPQHDMKEFISGLWETLQNLTTFYLLIFVIGISAFTNFYNNVNITLQYYVIKLTNFQAGVDTITTYAALVFAIWLFQKYLINRNWRYTQYGSTFFAAFLGLIWIFPYYNSGGTMDPWFTIFIDLDTSFAQGLSQVLYSMAVIELARPGQEATTYELIVTVGNAAMTVSGVIATQLMTPMRTVGCDDDYGNCSSNTVQVTDETSFRNSHGPIRFTYYTLVLNSISIVCCIIFTPFLPASKSECTEWKRRGEEQGTNKTRGYIGLFLAIITTLYGLAAAVMLLDSKTSCQPVIGGSGC